MNQYKILKISENQKFILDASKWFHERWHIPVSAYYDSMMASLDNEFVEWYIVRDDQKIIAGLGVIENDFHPRADLTPNVCALYVEDDYRKQGIAGQMLDYVCKDFKNKGISRLYLVTNHISFYERYQWYYLCDVYCDGEDFTSRIYYHDEGGDS